MNPHALTRNLAKLAVIGLFATDFKNREACEDFNEYITGLNEFQITLPPKLRGDHRCRDTTPSTRHNQPTPCNLALHPLEQVRMTRIDGQLFKPGAQKSFMALTQPPKPSENGFSGPQPAAGDVQWEWESLQSFHERYREELFGVTRLVPRKHSVQFSSKYRWQDTSESPSHNPPAESYKIGDMEAQMLLPPDDEDYVDPQACEAFNRYVESDRPEWLYALIPPMSSALDCAPVPDMTGSIPGNLTRQGCTTEMPAWSQTELSFIDGTEYSARCLQHRPLADHVLRIAQQRNNFHHFRVTEARAEMRSAPIPLADDQSLDMPLPTPIQPDPTYSGLTAPVVPNGYNWLNAKPYSAASTSEAQTWLEGSNLNEFVQEGAQSDDHRSPQASPFDVPVPRESGRVLKDLVDDSLDAPHEDDDLVE